MTTDNIGALNGFFDSRVGAIVVIIIGAYVVQYFAKVLLEKVVRRTVRRSSFKTAQDEKQREDTLISTLKRALRVSVGLIAFFMVLAELGLNIAPLLAGAGVLGVALGFGAQTMIKDYLAGFFIIAENQYRVGDVLQINRDVSGTVEHITLRVTILRDLQGMVHHIPNGTIEVATNMTMDFAQVDLNLRVGYDADIDHVEKVINAVGEKLAKDEAWSDVIIEAPHMERVNEFAEWAIIVKVLCKTAPIHQWAVKGELLRRLKKAFDKEGIAIPLPQRVVHEAADTN